MRPPARLCFFAFLLIFLFANAPQLTADTVTTPTGGPVFGYIYQAGLKGRFLIQAEGSFQLPAGTGGGTAEEANNEDGATGEKTRGSQTEKNHQYGPEGGRWDKLRRREPFPLFYQQLKNNPFDWEAHLNLARRWSRLGEYGACLGHATLAIEKGINDPTAPRNSFEANYFRAYCLDKAGFAGDARSLYQEYLEKKPEDYRPHARLAVYYRLRGQGAKARLHADEARILKARFQGPREEQFGAESDFGPEPAGNSAGPAAPPMEKNDNPSVTDQPASEKESPAEPGFEEDDFGEEDDFD